MLRGLVSRDRKCVSAFINPFAAAMAGRTQIAVSLSGPVSPLVIEEHAEVTVLR